MRSKQVLGYCTKVAKIYDKNLLGFKFEPISVRFLLSIVFNLSKISQNLLELHDLRKPGLKKSV